MYALLKTQYHWHGMLADCIRICASSVAVQLEGAEFRPPHYLLPTAKDLKPFAVWCIDLIVKLRPAGPNGEQYVVVAICAFSKWLEVGLLNRKDAATISRWFHNNIACPYGTPLLVRSDRGTKFRGHFAAYLSSIGVQQAYISTAHPRANGLVERYNACIKAGIWRLCSSLPGVEWYTCIFDVVAGLRFLPVRSGYTPYLLAFK